MLPLLPRGTVPPCTHLQTSAHRYPSPPSQGCPDQPCTHGAAPCALWGVCPTSPDHSGGVGGCSGFSCPGISQHSTGVCRVPSLLSMRALSQPARMCCLLQPLLYRREFPVEGKYWQIFQPSCEPGSMEGEHQPVSRALAQAKWSLTIMAPRSCILGTC